MKKLILALIPLLIASCAADGSFQSWQERAEQDRIEKLDKLSMKSRVIDTIPICEGQQECQNKWDAAQVWVSNNSGFKIQTISSAIVETYNSPEGSQDLAMKIVKEPLGNNKNRIVISINCGNWLLGCRRDPLSAIQDFNNYINTIK